MRNPTPNSHWRGLTMILGLLALTACGGLGGIMGQGGGATAPSTLHPPGSYAPNTPMYWMSMATTNSLMAGMGEQGGLGGLIMGKMTGPSRTMTLQAASQASGTNPEANHDIPAGLKMGPTLPLVTPRVESRGTTERPESTPWAKKEEKPKGRIKFYWGCSETVRPGQPRIVDISKMSAGEMGKVFVGRTGSAQNPPAPRPGWTYGDWPNEKNSQKVPDGASLVGDHFVHGTYLPHIKFSLGPGQDFLAQAKLTQSGTTAESVRLQWESIPGAIGYFAMAMGQEEKTGDMVIWSSSDVPEPGWGLLDYLPSGDVRRFIQERVVLPAGVTSCQVPQGIFKDSGGAYLQFIAWGEDFVAAKKPEWSLKARYKSTAAVMLGLAGSGASGGQKKGSGGGLLDIIKGIF
ncbi:MAG: hypothetical protein AB1641_20875 [Thermodesulfobacteriota bacterium]